MTADLSLRVYTGSNAGTESAAQTDIVLCADDALFGGDVAPGTVSYERWLRLRVDAAPTTGVANFWLANTGALPEGVTILFGVTDTPATPVNTRSEIAVKQLTSGQRFVFDAGTLTDIGQHSRYVVLQEVVAAGADAGAIPENSFQFGWAEA